MAAVHVQFMKEMMEEDIGKVEQLAGKSISPRPLIRRMSSISSISKLMTGAGSEGAVSRIIREKIVNPATGKPISVARVFVVTPENLPYQDVGWIHRSCIDKCMICNASFGMMNRKHNCTACGNVVCNSCSNREAEVEQLQSLRLKPEENKMKYRVCKRCIKGAVRLLELCYVDCDVIFWRMMIIIYCYDCYYYYLFIYFAIIYRKEFLLLLHRETDPHRYQPLLRLLPGRHFSLNPMTMIRTTTKTMNLQRQRGIHQHRQ